MAIEKKTKRLKFVLFTSFPVENKSYILISVLKVFRVTLFEKLVIALFESGRATKRYPPKQKNNAHINTSIYNLINLH